MKNVLTLALLLFAATFQLVHADTLSVQKTGLRTTRLTITGSKDGSASGWVEAMKKAGFRKSPSSTGTWYFGAAVSGFESADANPYYSVVIQANSSSTDFQVSKDPDGTVDGVLFWRKVAEELFLTLGHAGYESTGNAAFESFDTPMGSCIHATGSSYSCGLKI